MDGPLLIEISVSFAKNGEELLITIADNGHGIAPEALSALNGATVQNTAEPSSGSIGVANVRDRIRLRFGPPHTLLLVSEPEQGTRAELHLPFKPEDGGTAPAMNGGMK
ncbi:Histidine kinase-, DNA gyrase B-, and HSP90-like ATPase [compost metagenome]